MIDPLGFVTSISCEFGIKTLPVAGSTIGLPVPPNPLLGRLVVVPWASRLARTTLPLLCLIFPGQAVALDDVIPDRA
jgi:hypothetical protein